MRIAFFVEQFPRLSEAFIASSAGALIEAGHEVDIYALGGAIAVGGQRHPALDRHDLMTRTRTARVNRGWRKRVVHAPRDLVTLTRRHGTTALRALDPAVYGRGAASLRALGQAIMFPARARYDVLHCQFGHLVYDVLAHRKAGFVSGKVVVQFRGFDITQVIAHSGADHYARAFQEADGFLANSAFFRDRAVALGCPADRIDIAYTGIELAQFPFAPATPPAKGEAVRLASVGRLVEKKGLNYALEAVAALKADGVAVRHVIVGDGPERAALERQADALGLAGEVSFLGALAHAGVAEVLRDSHVFLAPSVTGSDSNADAPINTLKEAMAIGVPVVSTLHGGIPELVTDGVTGFLAPERDSAALAGKLREALAAGPHWPDLTERAHETVTKTFDIARTTSSLLESYRKAIAR
jgi:colanic acid/amylovoran biosynthesis glycosyltransferase